MTDRIKTWGELEAEGVRRCCAIFTSGKRCRRRAVEQFSSSGPGGGQWCSKHGPLMKEQTDFALKAIEQQKQLDK